jgi:GNAT superfamily N-acetyltransferase
VRSGDWERWRAIRLAALRDSPEAFGSTYEQELGYPAELWQERVEVGATSAERALFIAGHAGRDVGCAGGFRDQPGAAPSLISMWVDPRARRLGAARALLHAVRGWAKGTGASELRLHVVSTQRPARSLYESCGFGYTGRSEAGRRDPSQVLLEMALPLTSP